MNKNDSRYFNTAVCFDEALIFLLDKKDIDYITVKEICKKAGVNRSTFYLHYEGINDLVEETMEYINNKFIAYFNVNSAELVNSIKTTSTDNLQFINSQFLTPYLTFVKENKKIFAATLKYPERMRSSLKYSSLKQYVLLPILERFGVAEKEKDYLLTFYVNGITAIIKEWIKNGCEDSIEYIESLIIKYVIK